MDGWMDKDVCMEEGEMDRWMDNYGCTSDRMDDWILDS
jgi:hypothetical protein